jgi:hypothetical protein
MYLTNPAFRKFIKGIHDANNRPFETAEDLPVLSIEMTALSQKFEKRVAKQLLTLSKKSQINLLEQILFDFEGNKEGHYVEKY